MRLKASLAHIFTHTSYKVYGRVPGGVMAIRQNDRSEESASLTHTKKRGKFSGFMKRKNPKASRFLSLMRQYSEIYRLY